MSKDLHPMNRREIRCLRPGGARPTETISAGATEAGPHLHG